MSQVTILKLRIAFMTAAILATLWQVYRERPPEPDPDEPRQYLRPVEQLAPHRVIHYPCPASAAEGGVCSTVGGAPFGARREGHK